MLKLRIIVVDRTRAAFLRDGESYYLKRLGQYAQVDWIEVKPVKISKSRSPEHVLAEEGRNLEKKFAPRDYLIALDRSGKQVGSRALAEWLHELSIQVAGGVSFIIGGPLGLSPGILKRSDAALSLSALTLTHEMSRIILLEQLYRALTILRGESYHK